MGSLFAGVTHLRALSSHGDDFLNLVSLKGIPVPCAKITLRKLAHRNLKIRNFSLYNQSLKWHH